LNSNQVNAEHINQLSSFLAGKSDYTLMLYNHFLTEFKKIGNITVEPAKTMIGISNSHKRISWVTQLGKILFMWCFRSNSLMRIIYVSRK